MKKKRISGIYMPVILIAASYRKDETPALKAEINTGKWRLSQYVDNGEDKTHWFPSYTITFNPNNTVTVNVNNNNYVGTWQFDDISRRVTLSMPSALHFYKLTGNWILTDSTERYFKLRNANLFKTEMISFIRV
jgi:hypothetical protein